MNDPEHKIRLFQENLQSHAVQIAELKSDNAWIKNGLKDLVEINKSTAISVNSLAQSVASLVAKDEGRSQQQDVDGKSSFNERLVFALLILLSVAFGINVPNLLKLISP